MVVVVRRLRGEPFRLVGSILRALKAQANYDRPNTVGLGSIVLIFPPCHYGFGIFQIFLEPTSALASPQ